MTNDYRGRALRIVDRVMPAIRVTPHGFHDPKGFIAAAQYSNGRARLFWRTFARLRAKAEGGAPYLKVPQSAALVGGTLWTVARELAAEAAA